MKTSFRSRAFTVVAGLTIAGSLFVFAGGVSAAALTNSQVTAVLALLQSFGVDQATITNVQGVLTGAGSTVSSSAGLTSTSTATLQTKPSIVYPSTASSSCATISSDMHVGSQGTEVEQLQAFLAKNPNYYPQGIVSGYYGKLTEDAVGRWQAAQGIVSTGTPETTGYGDVGPQTRVSMDHQMEVECESEGHSSAGGSEGSDHASATSTEAHASEGESHASATSTWAHSSQNNQGSDSQQSSSSSTSQDN